MPRKNKIIIRTGAGAPSASDFATGEPAFDSSAGSLYIKNAAGTMAQITGGGGGGSGSVDVYEFATTANFPATGAAAVIYIATDTGRTYRWAGTAYIEMGPIGSDVDSLLRSLLVPAAPTGLTVVSGNGLGSLTWTAPAVVPPVTDYVVQYSSNSGGTWTTFSDGTSTATSATVTGLTNGTGYVFRVAGVNGVGTGAYSAVSNSVVIGSDSFFSNVALLLPMDTAFTDISGTPKTVSNTGGVISTAKVKNGAGSGLFNISSGTDVLQIPHHASLSFQSGDSFTVECWYYPTSFGTYNYLISKGLGGNTREWSLGVTGSTVIWYRQTGGSDLSFAPSATVTLNQWTHLAAVCNGTTVTLYKDGVGLGSTSWGTPDGYAYSRPLWIMQFLDYRNIAHEGRGYIDNIRITKNVARYTANFTPPAAAFPTS